MTNHFHFIVWAAMDRVTDKFSEVTYIDVVSDSMDHAQKKAQELCPGRRYYWVNNIVEKHGSECDD